MTRVAVVIPVGRVEPSLDVQLRAVAAQVLAEPFDVVLSLNTAEAGARDRLEAVARPVFGEQLRIVDSSDRRGAAHARNVGIRASGAEIVACCDADDEVHPGWLAALVAALDDADGATGHVVDVFVDDRMAAWHPPATPDALPQFLGRPYLLTGNLAVRVPAFEAVGGFDETLTRCEDIDLGWTMTDAGFRLAYAPDAILDYHHRPGIVPMVRQHRLYGIGMAEVLAKHGATATSTAAAPAAGGGGRRVRWLALLRPNGQRASRFTLGGLVRRGALAVGRVEGAVRARRRSRRETRR